MAIAIDNSATASGSGGSITIANFAVSSSNPILFVAVVGGYAGSGSNSVTGVTYNGVAMTLIDKWQDTDSTTRDVYLYVLVGYSGTHDIIVSTTGAANYTGAVAVSYTGAKQTGQPDAHNKAHTSSSTSLTTSLTTVADNCWTIMVSYAWGAQITAGSGSTMRYNATDFAVLDSNGAIHPAGSYSMAVDRNNSNYAYLTSVMASFAPALGSSAKFFEMVNKA